MISQLASATIPIKPATQRTEDAQVLWSRIRLKTNISTMIVKTTTAKRNGTRSCTGVYTGLKRRFSGRLRLCPSSLSHRRHLLSSRRTHLPPLRWLCCLGELITPQFRPSRLGSFRDSPTPSSRHPSTFRSAWWSPFPRSSNTIAGNRIELALQVFDLLFDVDEALELRCG